MHFTKYFTSFAPETAQFKNISQILMLPDAFWIYILCQVGCFSYLWFRSVYDEERWHCFWCKWFCSSFCKSLNRRAVFLNPFISFISFICSFPVLLLLPASALLPPAPSLLSSCAAISPHLHTYTHAHTHTHTHHRPVAANRRILSSPHISGPRPPLRDGEASSPPECSLCPPGFPLPQSLCVFISAAVSAGMINCHVCCHQRCSLVAWLSDRHREIKEGMFTLPSLVNQLFPADLSTNLPVKWHRNQEFPNVFTDDSGITKNRCNHWISLVLAWAKSCNT